MGRNFGPGAAAGLFGGLIFGLLMQFTTMIAPGGERVSLISAAADVVHVHHPAAGWLLVLVYGVVIGAGFGWLMRTRMPSAWFAMAAGLVYSVVWWLALSVIVVPALRGHMPLSSSAIDLARKVAGWTLIGSGLYGVVLGATLFGMRLRSRHPHRTQVPEQRTPRAA
jgi:hypothetical protein